MQKTFLAVVFFSALGTRAFTPAGLPPEESGVYAYCAAIATPSLDDFMDATDDARDEEIVRIFGGGDEVLLREPDDADRSEAANRNYTEVSFSGGAGRLDAYAFEGLQVGPIAFVGGYEENHYGSKDDVYNIVRRGASGSFMLTDPAGTMFGVSAEYAGKKETSAEVPGLGLDCASVTAMYRSHFWGSSKLSTKITDTYSRQIEFGPTVTDNLIEADTNFTFLWLGDNSLKGSIYLQQENINGPGDNSVGALYTAVLIGNDFRLSEKIRFGAGLSGFVLRRDATLTRLYPKASLHVGLTRHVGVFAKYAPYTRVPTFRELYYETDYTAADAYVPFADAYGVFELGLVNNMTDALHASATIFEKRYRYDYASGDVGDGFKTQYYDVGKYRTRGISVRARVDLHRVISLFGEYDYESIKLIDVPESHIPYRPGDASTAGVDVGRPTRYHLTADVIRVGKRYADATGTAVLSAAVIAGASFRVHLYKGLTAYVKGENLGDADYYVIRRVTAPGRTISVGFKLVL